MKIQWKYLLLVAVSVILAGNLISAYLRTLATEPGVIYSFETRNAEFEFLVDPAGFEPAISCVQSRRLPARPRALCADERI